MDFKMAATVFLCFLVVLHATGTFSHSFFPYQDINFHRPSSKIKVYPNQYLTFRDFERFNRNRLHIFPSVDRNFDYQILPSSLVGNNGRDSIVLSPLKENLKGSVSLNYNSASSREKLPEYKTPETGKNFEFPDASSELPHIIMNTSSATSNKISGQLPKSENDDISLILDEENVVTDDNNVSTSKLHSITSDDKNTSENTSLKEEKRNNTKLKETTEIITDMNDSKGYTVIEEIKEGTASDEKDEEGNINVAKETSDTTSDVENIHGKTTANEETSGTTVDETSKTTVDENEIDGETTTKEETNDITVGKEEKINMTVAEDIKDKISVEEEKENTTTNKDMSIMTTVEDMIDITSGKKQISIHTTDIETDITTEGIPATENRNSLSPDVPDIITNDITQTTDNDGKSIVHETTLPANNHKTEDVSGPDFSSSKLESRTSSTTRMTKVTPPSISQTVPTGNTNVSSKSGYFPTMSPNKKSSSSVFVTTPVQPIPEHIINIRSIKTAKTVLAVLLLATGLIAVAVLAAYFFRVRRKAVQYDQLTLLP